jgi:hypothetical protein
MSSRRIDALAPCSRRRRHPGLEFGSICQNCGRRLAGKQRVLRGGSQATLTRNDTLTRRLDKKVEHSFIHSSWDPTQATTWSQESAHIFFGFKVLGNLVPCWCQALAMLPDRATIDDQFSENQLQWTREKHPLTPHPRQTRYGSCQLDVPGMLQMQTVRKERRAGEYTDRVQRRQRRRSCRRLTIQSSSR